MPRAARTWRAQRAGAHVSAGNLIGCYSYDVSKVTSEYEGDELRVTPSHRTNDLPTEERLRIFREAMKRVANRDEETPPPNNGGSRGWTRDELYDRDRTR